MTGTCCSCWGVVLMAPASRGKREVYPESKTREGQVTWQASLQESLTCHHLNMTFLFKKLLDMLVFLSLGRFRSSGL